MRTEAEKNKKIKLNSLYLETGSSLVRILRRGSSYFNKLLINTSLVTFDALLLKLFFWNESAFLRWFRFTNQAVLRVPAWEFTDILSKRLLNPGIFLSGRETLYLETAGFEIRNLNRNGTHEKKSSALVMMLETTRQFYRGI